MLGGLATVRGDSRFTTWAVTVAVRVAFTELRRAKWQDVSLDRLVEDAPARQPTAPSGGHSFAGRAAGGSRRNAPGTRKRSDRPTAAGAWWPNFEECRRPRLRPRWG